MERGSRPVIQTRGEKRRVLRLLSTTLLPAALCPSYDTPCGACGLACARDANKGRGGSGLRPVSATNQTTLNMVQQVPHRVTFSFTRAALRRACAARRAPPRPQLLAEAAASLSHVSGKTKSVTAQRRGA